MDNLLNFTDIDKMHRVLSTEQIDVLKKIKNNLELHYETVQVFRSEVEMKFSVLNDGKFPTADAKYWQAVREQTVHFTNLVVLNFEYETEEINIKNKHDEIRRLNHKIKTLLNKEDKGLSEFEIEGILIETDILQNKIDTLNIEIKKANFFQLERKKVASNRWREVITWENIMLELLPKMKYGVLSYEYHQPGSYEQRMHHQLDVMNKSGAKGSPSEAINITNQNDMIKKLIANRTLGISRELPIKAAVKKVLSSVEDNYANNPELLDKRLK